MVAQKKCFEHANGWWHTTILMMKTKWLNVSELSGSVYRFVCRWASHMPSALILELRWIHSSLLHRTTSSLISISLCDIPCELSQATSGTRVRARTWKKCCGNAWNVVLNKIKSLTQTDNTYTHMHAYVLKWMSTKRTNVQTCYKFPMGTKPKYKTNKMINSCHFIWLNNIAAML